MKTILCLLCLFSATLANAQQYDLSGQLLDKDNKPVIYVAVSLLDPKDSTLAFFGVSDAQGQYTIRSVKTGNYLLQIAGVGYKSVYAQVKVPLSNGNSLGVMKLEDLSTELANVQVKGEKVPIMLKGDTIEYNAGSYKVKPDASTEELLRKLPGVEVDQAGNVKAQGKDVAKVLVDGKPFFSDDPKVPTKNLPADAIDKVQVYDGKSDQSLFSGIDDGEREKTINLMLKDGKKQGHFGDVEAGYGTGDHYKASAKYYRFRKKSQLAGLGMLNNINQFGFSLQDYISFKGGLRGLMSGGLELNGNNLPVNFGQPVTGLITSGAVGLNYTYEPRKNNRFNVSYLGNGTDKKQDEHTTTTNYTGTETVLQEEQANDRSTDIAHRLHVNWRNDIDSAKQLIVDAGGEINTSTSARALLSSSKVQDAILNRLDSRVDDNGDGYSSDLGLSYQQRFKGRVPLWKLAARGSYDQSMGRSRWDNQTLYPALGTAFTDRQYQNNRKLNYSYEASSSVFVNLGKGYLEPSVRAGQSIDALERNQGMTTTETDIDSLSPAFVRTLTWARPGLSYRFNTKKVQTGITLQDEAGSLRSSLDKNRNYESDYNYVLPSGYFQYEYSQGARFSAYYNTMVNSPAARQMLPVTDYTNPIQRFRGNPDLRPEYVHSLHANWLRFDAFSFTSVMLSAGGRYTHDKINWTRNINPDLSQDVSFRNVSDDYDLDGRAEYSAPIRKLGVKFSFAFKEEYSRGITYVNDVQNYNDGFTHTASLTIDNRKKEKLDWSVGGSASVSTAKYSIQNSLNNTFYHYRGFAQINYRPTDKFFFSVNADVDHYDAQSFDESVTVPLLRASASYYFLKANRGVITIDAFDLLNQNKSIQRSSQLNYLMEKQTNIIGQYFILTFKYRLNKLGGNAGPKMDIKIDR